MFTRGDLRQLNMEYYRLNAKVGHLRRRGQYKEAKRVRQQASKLPSKNPNDLGYRRLRYVRYADDFLLGFCGPQAEAEDIKARIGEFLRETLKLELSQTKTLVTHARSEKARFLSYHIHTLQDNARRNVAGGRVNGAVGLEMPRDVTREKSQRYLKNGKSVHRIELLNNSDYDIIMQYQQEYRGIVEYYRLAYNLYHLGYLKHVMECSLTKTLARKYKITVRQVYKRYKTMLQTPNGPRKGLQVVVEREGKKPLTATWGGISLKRDLGATLNDAPRPYISYGRTELVQRLLADTCEICGSNENVQVHHIRAMRDLKKPGQKPKPLWAEIMIARNRKTLVVCRNCHQDIHAGRPLKRSSTD